MIEFTQGNLLESDAEALVNTVNTVGVMGKGVALMFKEAFPENFAAYESACKRHEVRTGRMFVTHIQRLGQPAKWIINFPTKEKWFQPSKYEWIETGLADLKRLIIEKSIHSIAIPPLGSGNGHLKWEKVRPLIEAALGDLDHIQVIVYEPTDQYQNVAKRTGVEKLTPSRALIAELVRRYWILGIECTLLEIQKLAYFIERYIAILGLPNELDLRFQADKFGPYAPRLSHLLNALDGSYLHCEKRIGDAGPFDVIWFTDAKKDRVALYLASEAKVYQPALEATTELINGFESPLGMELLATVDWLLKVEHVPSTVEAVKVGLANWRGGGREAARRKQRLFSERLITLALERLARLDYRSATSD
ncbi:MAG TPA: macro domain-containing protein [Stellaceae bacterium]|jgi:O-acetyl-ADP-ribose deacetylase (regulator of RNase III)